MVKAKKTTRQTRLQKAVAQLEEKMEVAMETTTVRFPKADREALAKAAKADMRTSSQLLQKILHDWLKERGLVE